MSLKDKNILNFIEGENVGRGKIETINHEAIKYDDNRIKKIVENYDKNLNKLVILDKNDKQMKKRMEQTLDTIDYYDKYFKGISIDGRKQKKRIIQEHVTSENFFKKKDNKKNTILS